MESGETIKAEFANIPPFSPTPIERGGPHGFKRNKLRFTGQKSKTWLRQSRSPIETKDCPKEQRCRQFSDVFLPLSGLPR